MLLTDADSDAPIALHEPRVIAGYGQSRVRVAVHIPSDLQLIGEWTYRVQITNLRDARNSLTLALRVLVVRVAASAGGSSSSSSASSSVSGATVSGASGAGVTDSLVCLQVTALDGADLLSGKLELGKCYATVPVCARFRIRNITQEPLDVHLSTDVVPSPAAAGAAIATSNTSAALATASAAGTSPPAPGEVTFALDDTSDGSGAHTDGVAAAGGRGAGSGDDHEHDSHSEREPDPEAEPEEPDSIDSKEPHNKSPDFKRRRSSVSSSSSSASKRVGSRQSASASASDTARSNSLLSPTLGGRSSATGQTLLSPTSPHPVSSQSQMNSIALLPAVKSSSVGDASHSGHSQHRIEELRLLPGMERTVLLWYRADSLPEEVLSTRELAARDDQVPPSPSNAALSLPSPHAHSPHQLHPAAPSGAVSATLSRTFTEQQYAALGNFSVRKFRVFLRCHSVSAKRGQVCRTFCTRSFLCCRALQIFCLLCLGWL